MVCMVLFIWMRFRVCNIVTDKIYTHHFVVVLEYWQTQTKLSAGHKNEKRVEKRRRRKKDRKKIHNWLKQRPHTRKTKCLSIYILAVETKQ